DGEYVLKVTIKGPADQQKIEVRLDRSLVKQFDLSKPGIGRNLDVRFPAKAGTHLVGVAFISTLDRSLPIDGRPASVPITSFEFSQSAIEMLQVTGPYNGQVPEETASRAKVLVCRPGNRVEEKGCARQILSQLARRAYRRPVTDAEVGALLATYERGRATG